MQFEALKVFCDIARCRSFSQAAAANGLTQSAASQIVHNLEERLDVQLINRATRPLQLTEPGQVFFEGCNGLVEQYLALEASVRKAGAQAEATVQVAAIYSVGLGDMGLYVERFQAAHPHARVQVEYLPPDQVYAKVLEGTTDFGLLSFPRKSRELSVLPWRDEEMVLACAPDHPLAGREAVRPADLDGAKYVGFAKGLTIRRKVDRFLRDHGVAVAVELEFDTVENIKEGIECRKGVALLPEPTLRREVRSGLLAARPLAGCRFVRPLGILRRRHHRLGATAQRFLDLLLELGDNGRSPEGEAEALAGRRSPGRVNGTAHGTARPNQSPKRKRGRRNDLAGASGFEESKT
jgi:DNA-binding transcriptional LysR family regulator